MDDLREVETDISDPEGGFCQKCGCTFENSFCVPGWCQHFDGEDDD